MNKYIVIYCTVPSMEDAEKIADTLVESKFAACANIISGIKSVYSWKNEICRDDELLLVIKSKQTLFEQIKNTILSLHPYEVPEIISLPITNGHSDYLDWIGANTISSK